MKIDSTNNYMFLFNFSTQPQSSQFEIRMTVSYSVPSNESFECHITKLIIIQSFIIWIPRKIYFILSETVMDKKGYVFFLY